MPDEDSQPGGRLLPRLRPVPLTPDERTGRARRLRSWVIGDDDLPGHLDDWPADWHEAYEERAAIMEYLGGLPRPEAERRALQITRAQHAAARPSQHAVARPSPTARGPPARPPG